MAKTSKSFVCGHCGEEFNVIDNLPDVPEGSVLVCSECNNKLIAAAKMFFFGGE